jgi:hypothetical protein
MDEFCDEIGGRLGFSLKEQMGPGNGFKCRFGLDASDFFKTGCMNNAVFLGLQVEDRYVYLDQLSPNVTHQDSPEPIRQDYRLHGLYR